MLSKDKKKTSAETTTISTLLGRDTIIEGTLQFKETIRVDGQIKGKLISSEGSVIVGENAVIEADMQVAVAVIRGTINGRVEAKERIEIYAPAQVTGDICAPSIAIDSGVIFNGNCQMKGQTSIVNKPVENMPKDQQTKEGDSRKVTKNL
jgi:cytoskeletal protein CcmA (bactofilin family)